MSDMDAVTAAKSDQINADDLVGTEMRVTVDSVIIRAGTEQPITVKLAGHDKVFRPCKTVARVMKAAWGADSSKYPGRSMLLYRDDSVTWGGMKVGGIRVRAISDITSPLVLALQEKKGSKKMTTVQPLKVEPQTDAAAEWTNGFIAGLDNLRTVEAITADEANNAKPLARIKRDRPDLDERIRQAIDARLAFLSGEKRDDADMGESMFGKSVA